MREEVDKRWLTERSGPPPHFKVFTGTRIERGGQDRDPIIRVVKGLLQEWYGLVIVGDCRTGVDRIVRSVATKFGLPITVHAADPLWKWLGKRAGPVRNACIAAHARILLKAGLRGEFYALPHNEFPSPGTDNCQRQLEALGVKVQRIPTGRKTEP